MHLLLLGSEIVAQLLLQTANMCSSDVMIWNLYLCLMRTTCLYLIHLCLHRGDWGPHLIVVPTSVMLNWEMECKKWCPAFKLLTYFGSAKERKLKRHGWSKPNAFHICITSYTLVLQVRAALPGFTGIRPVLHSLADQL